MTFGREARALQMGRATIASDRATRADHAVVRQPRVWCFTKNVPDGACGAWTSGEPRNIAIRRHASHGNARDDAQDASAEDGRAQRSIASASTRPSARGKLTWLI